MQCKLQEQVFPNPRLSSFLMFPDIYILRYEKNGGLLMEILVTFWKAFVDNLEENSFIKIQWLHVRRKDTIN